MEPAAHRVGVTMGKAMVTGGWQLRVVRQEHLIRLGSVVSLIGDLDIVPQRPSHSH